MAPALDRAGYWGPPTSTLDWCEENYAVTWLVAEFCECGLRRRARALVVGRRGVEETEVELGLEGRHQAGPGSGKGRAGLRGPGERMRESRVSSEDREGLDWRRGVFILGRKGSGERLLDPRRKLG